MMGGVNEHKSRLKSTSIAHISSRCGDVCCEADFRVFCSAVPTYPTDNNNGEAKPAGEIISEWSCCFPDCFGSNIFILS